MKKIIMLLWIFFLSANYIFPQKNDLGRSKANNEKRTPDIEQIRKNLESEKSFDRKIPFVLRAFKPYLNTNWIGNAVSYGCYRKGQAPGKNGPSESEVFEDLNIISKYWNLIRVYSSDNDTELILRVIKNNNLPIRVMLGVWLENEENNPDKKNQNIKQVVSGIALANNYKDIVKAVNVGNETQVFWSGHRMSSESLIRYIRAVRNNTNVPVTTADDYNFWNKPESKLVANEIDFIVTHIYPLWNGKTLEEAIEWTDKIYNKDVKNNHPGKSVIIGETGWATEYNAAKTGPGEQGTLIKGTVNLDSQEKFLINLNLWIKKNKISTFLFEVFDEPWKGGGENSDTKEIEKHWGVFYEDRTPKESFKNYLNHNQNK